MHLWCGEEAIDTVVRHGQCVRQKLLPGSCQPYLIARHDGHAGTLKIVGRKNGMDEGVGRMYKHGSGVSVGGSR